MNAKTVVVDFRVGDRIDRQTYLADYWRTTPGQLPRVHAHPQDLAETYLADTFEQDESGWSTGYEREHMIDAYDAGFRKARELTAAAMERGHAAPAAGQAAYEAFLPNGPIAWEYADTEVREMWARAAQAAIGAAPGTGLYLAAIARLSAALREVCAETGTSTMAHHIARKALDDTDQPQRLPDLRAQLDEATYRGDRLEGQLEDARAECGQARALLQQAADALWNLSKTALTVKTSLDQPYPDAPGLTPWTRWVERPARQAHDVAMAIRKHLRGASPAAARDEREAFIRAAEEHLATPRLPRERDMEEQPATASPDAAAQDRRP